VPWFLIVILFLSATSGLILKLLSDRNIKTSSWSIPIITVLIGIVVSIYLRSFSEAITFFAAAIFQFAAFVFVSRLRQRGSFFWHTIAALASNGAWYLTIHVIKISDAYWLLFILYILGLISGRLTGVIWAQYIESKYKLTADATRDERLAPGKRLALIGKEKTFWTLIISLTGYMVYGYLGFEISMFKSMAVVIGLGLIQSFFYAISTRASARGSNWFIVTSGLLGGLAFYVNAAYLVSNNVPVQLVIPYVISTVLGSTTGAFFSMIIEYMAKLGPDSHIDNRVKQKSSNQKIPYLVILSLGTVWIFFQEPVLNFFGYSQSQLKFPVSIVTIELPRTFIILAVSFIFMLDNALHTLTSRAGNRDHTGYHITTLIPKGLVDFLKISYIAQNPSIPDLLPVALLSGCLGSLFGKDISEKIEKCLQARMDVVTK